LTADVRILRAGVENLALQDLSNPADSAWCPFAVDMDCRAERFFG
jgi:hypothetical protein